MIMNTSLVHSNIFRIFLLGVVAAIVIPSVFVATLQEPFGIFMGSNSGNPGSNPAKGASVPIISSVEARELTNSTAVIRWKTKRAADRQVEYGISEVYELASFIDTRPGTKHEVFLVNLEPGLTYHFRVRSRDPVGSLAFSEDSTFTTLSGKRGQASICGWDGDSIERVDTFCASNDGWAKGESWTASCGAVWSQPASRLVSDCVYQFSDVKAQKSSVGPGESWQVALEPGHTGWIDILQVDSPSEKDIFSPAAKYAERGLVTMDELSAPGKYTFRFRPADDSAAWSDLLTINVHK